MLPIKQRAVTDEQRMERRQVLLDAAWRLFQEYPYEKINVIDVARAAGLAKGTVYLYFPTKETLFLAVQTAQLTEWFDELEQELASLGSDRTSPQVAEIICVSLSHRPALTRLFAILHTILEENIDYPTALAFKQLLLERIIRLGAALEACLPVLRQGQGAQSAMRIYTFLLGLQQLTNPAPIVREVIAREPGMGIFNFNFCRECQAAVTAFLSSLGNGSDENEHE